ncbi:hypothetical protein LCGC14_2987870, partial [marine sediment metagenome]
MKRKLQILFWQISWRCASLILLTWCRRGMTGKGITAAENSALIKRDRVAYLFLAPAIISFVVFMVVPVYMVGHFSLQKTNYVFTE